MSPAPDKVGIPSQLCHVLHLFWLDLPELCCCRAYCLSHWELHEFERVALHCNNAFDRYCPNNVSWVDYVQENRSPAPMDIPNPHFEFDSGRLGVAILQRGVAQLVAFSLRLNLQPKLLISCRYG